MNRNQTEKIAQAVQLILDHFGVKNSIATIQDGTVANMMIDDDLVFSNNQLRVFSVGDKVYVVDYVTWREDQNQLDRDDSLLDSEVRKEIAFVERKFIWDIDAKQQRLYRSDDAWENLILELEKKALDEDYAKNPPDNMSLAEGFVETK